MDPRGAKKKKADLSQRAKSLYIYGMGVCRQNSNTYVKNATATEIVLLIESIEGNRNPEIFTVAQEYGNVVERKHPYRAEFRPTELVWARLKGGYGRACEATGVRNRVETFSEGVSEADLTAIVRHCDQADRDIADGATSIVLDVDMAPEVEDAAFPLSGEANGEMPDF